MRLVSRIFILNATNTNYQALEITNWLRGKYFISMTQSSGGVENFGNVYTFLTIIAETAKTAEK